MCRAPCRIESRSASSAWVTGKRSSCRSATTCGSRISPIFTAIGAEAVTLNAVAEVDRGLETALQGADLIGVRNDVVGVSAPPDLLDRSSAEVMKYVTSNFHIRKDEIANLSGIGARRIALLHRALSGVEWGESQRFCSTWIHWELLASGAIARILEDIDHVGLITSRPELEQLVGRRFDVETSMVIVPDKFVEVPASGHHVPARFRTIRPEFDFPKGTVVLVGAGIPGKVYCQWLKESGCVAIDVGAIFDAWVGKASRPRVLESRFNVKGGASVPTELQLRRPDAPSGRRLTPKWKPGALA